MRTFSITALRSLVTDNSDAFLRDQLLQFLGKLPGLDTAPASGALRYHHAYEGGLIDHIFDTFGIACDLVAVKTGRSKVPQISKQDILLVAILHDIHKVQDSVGTPYYKLNILKSGKRSEAEPFDHHDGYLKQACVSTGASAVQREVDFLYKESVDGIPGGIKSLALIHALEPDLYAVLSEDVKFAIRYHDGCYAHNKFDLNGKETPLMIIFHAADMLSSRLNRLK